jgi:hypothetical protein
MRRFIPGRARILVLMAISMFGLAPSVPSTLAASYHYACDSSSQTVTQFFAARGQGFQAIAPPQTDPYLIGTDYEGVIGDATVRNQYICDLPTGTVYSFPLVIPVNLEKSSSEIVQLGWIKCGKGGGLKCNNQIPNDGSTRFFYTCNDHNGGGICDATSWAGSPLYGRRYRFRIQYNQDGTAGWNFSITDLSSGVVKKSRVTKSWNQSARAWWGAENQDLGSTLGPALGDGNNQINMYWMQYLRASIGSWQVVTGLSDTNTVLGVSSPLTPPATFYRAGIHTVNFSQDTLYIWTDPH